MTGGAGATVPSMAATTRAERIADRERNPKWQNPPLLIDMSICINCDTCIRHCPPQFGAIFNHGIDVVIIPELCSGCEKCIEPCPVDCIYPDPHWTPAPDVFALTGERVRLRPPRWGDYRAWSELRDISRDFLQPWEPTWADDDLSKPAFRRRLAAYRREMELGEAYAFFILRAQDDALVGSLRLSNVRRGVAQTATLGYWIGEPYARRGYMLDAVRTALTNLS